VTLCSCYFVARFHGIPGPLHRIALESFLITGR
jgi:hypothetical protein